MLLLDAALLLLEAQLILLPGQLLLTLLLGLRGSFRPAVVLMGLELAPQALHVQPDEEEEGHHGSEDDEH